MNKNFGKLYKRRCTYIIFKPHFIFFSDQRNLSMSAAFDELCSKCVENNLTKLLVINTSFENEEQLRSFYPHIVNEPFFKDIKRDYLENSIVNLEGEIVDFDKEEDRKNIQYKKTNYFIAFLLQDNLDVPRNEKEFYSNIRKMVDFSEENSCEKENRVNRSLRDNYALDKNYNSIHYTDSAESFEREEEVILSLLSKKLNEKKQEIVSGFSKEKVKFKRKEKSWLFLPVEDVKNKKVNYTIHADKGIMQSNPNRKVQFFNRIRKNYYYSFIVKQPVKKHFSLFSFFNKIFSTVPKEEKNGEIKLYDITFIYLSYIVNQSNITRQEKKQNLDWETFKAASLTE